MADLKGRGCFEKRKSFLQNAAVHVQNSVSQTLSML